MTTSRAGRLPGLGGLLLTTALAAGSAFAPTALASPTPSAPEVVDEARPEGTMVIVLDASGSMAASAGGGTTRIQAAKQALTDVVRDLPEGTKAGLRVYGDQVKEGDGSCTDTRLLVPVGPLDRDALNAAIAGIRELGNTPIAHSLRVAADDLPTSGPRSVVLVSDGEETCGGDPCQAARDIAEAGIDVRVDVIGFQVDPAARSQLTCVASAGRGTYYDAADATALSAQLRRLSARAARAYQPGGTPVVGTPSQADAPLVTTGQYLDTAAEEPRHYRVEPTGGTLHVAATVRPTTAALVEDERLTVAVLGATGEGCASVQETSIGAFDRLTPLSASVLLSTDDLASCGEGPLFAQVTRGRTDGQSLPLELVVLDEPPVEDETALPPAAAEGAYDVQAAPSPAPPAKTLGSPSFSAAPALAPGRYTDSGLVGETLIYRADLDWGQQLVCDVTAGAAPEVASALDIRGVQTSARLYGPTRQELSDRQLDEQRAGKYEGTADLALHAVTPPVRYANRDAGSHAEGAPVPGPYYCAVVLNGPPAFASAGEIPLTISIDVVGAAGEGAPSYVEAAGELDPSPSASPAGADAASPADDDGFPVAAALAVGAGLLAALLALLALQRRRARAAGATPGG